jgi:alpha-L-fucosidase
MDLRFGMFICIGSPTYQDEDWADPNMDPAVFNPSKLDCNQWADVAISAGMKYGCLTTKHHSGFCIWDTKTTDYNVMKSSYKHDIVKEYADAFRAHGLKVCLYYSVLDIHHNLRPGWIEPKKHTQFVKDQLTELLTKYGEISELVIDGWDASWSRISYEDVDFEQVYKLIKKLQPNCLVLEHNAAKYPAQEMFYTDVKHYEQNAGQKISKTANDVPAQAGIPINETWFWKTNSPTEQLKNVDSIVIKNLIPLNEAHCNFILSIEPNRDGLIDENAVQALKLIGQKWKNTGNAPKLPRETRPIIAHNLAKFQKSNSSWSDFYLSDFGNDDDFKGRAWISNAAVKQPWYEVDFDKPQTFNMIIISELLDGKKFNEVRILDYVLQYFDGAKWLDIPMEKSNKIVKVHRFSAVQGTKVRVMIDKFLPRPTIAEFGIYNEQ